MVKVSSVRLKSPKLTSGELFRKDLVDAILSNKNKITYIYAGAGYGKTTLLSQVSNSTEYVVWLTLDGESDVYAFLNALSEACKYTFPNYEFNPSEYLPFEGKSNFINILTNAFIYSLERLSKDFMIILEDLHTIEDPLVRKLISYIMKYKPESLSFCLSSRESQWQELVPLRVRGSIIEISRNTLILAKDEFTQIMGFYDENIYNLTEGWPLAIGSFKLLLKSGFSVADIPNRGIEILNSYLFYECISSLPTELSEFLKTSAIFEELEPEMLNTVLGINNSKSLINDLMSRSIFITELDGEQYRYHAIFKDYLLGFIEESQRVLFLNKAAAYYFEIEQYCKSSQLAIRLGNIKILEKIILICYKDYIKTGKFSELQSWFFALDNLTTNLSKELLVAKGVLLSSIGNFTASTTCLDAAIPLLNEDDEELYIEAMLHKSRTLRNFISFDASNKLLNELLPKLENQTSELYYNVAIEKIYNLCWSSRIREAHAFASHTVEAFAKSGNTKIKRWFERYFSVIYFLEGRMKESVYYYEKSFDIPEHERQYLNMHNIDIYVAKAYQMLGERDKAVSMIETTLHDLRIMGRYEELWLGYLFAAEIYYQNTFIDKMNGGSQTFDTTIKYFRLADEYAPLYRKNDYQVRWAKIQRNIYSLMFESGTKENLISDIFSNLDQIDDYFKTIALARLFSYYGSISDFQNAIKCAKMTIEIGEKANMMLLPTMAYGILARYAITTNDYNQAISLTKRYLQLCYENGIYEYFRMRKAYDLVLEFALNNNIEPDITKQMMAFAGYKTKKIYISTFGGLSVFLYAPRHEAIKMRTKKERELLAYLLESSNKGATKEQIYEAIWYDSDSDNIKKLIGVYLAQLKKDLTNLNIDSPIIKRERYYSISRDEIEVDIDLFEEYYKEFQLENNYESAQKLLSLYKGEYLSDFEAHWATAKRFRYSDIYKKALEFIQNFDS